MLGDEMSWSPDGRLLGFLGRPEPATVNRNAADVFVIGADGSGQQNVTGTPLVESDLGWSPDGAFLAYLTSTDEATTHLTTVRMDGSSPVAAPRLGPEGMVRLVAQSDPAALVRHRDGRPRDLPDDAPRDRAFLGPPATVLAVDGLIPCPPSWQRLAP